MQLPELAIKNFRFTLLLLFLLLLSGTISFLTMPRSEDPSFAPPGATIMVVWPGATALEMEEEVVNPIEESLKAISGLHRVRTTIGENLAIVGIRYLYGLDNERKFEEILRQVNAIQNKLPPDITDIKIEPVRTSDVHIYQIAFQTDSLPFSTLNHYAEKLQLKMENVPGILAADIYGVPEQEIRVDISPQRLAALGLPLEQVLGVIQASNTAIPSGGINMGSRRFNIKPDTKLTSLEDIRNTIISGGGGTTKVLSDVAEVRYAEKEKEARTRFDGNRAIFLLGRQKEDSNIFDIDDAIKPMVEEFKQTLPKGIQLEYAFDQTQSVRKRVNDFFSNLLQGVLLVGIVVWLFVGGRASLMIMFAVPVSIIIGLGFVDMSGFGMQQISIAGLVVALGLLVDNAIVVVENIARFVEMGDDPEEAAVKGAAQVGWPITTATLTTIFAFVPMLMIQDASGDFLKSMPATVIFTIIASLVVALMLSPWLCSKFFKKSHFEHKTWLQKKLDYFIENQYTSILNTVLKWPKITLLLAILAFAGSLSLFPLIGVSFFPKAEKPFLVINIFAPKGASIDRTDEITRFVEGVLRKESEVEHYASNIGRHNPKIYYNMFPAPYSEYMAQLLVRLKDYTPESNKSLIARLEAEFEQFPGADILIKEFEQGAPIEAPIAIRIKGPDLNKLAELAAIVEDSIRRIPGTQQVHNPLKVAQTSMEVKVNRNRAAFYGISTIEINRCLRAAFAGIEVSRLSDGQGNSYAINCRLGNGKPMTVEGFNNLTVKSLNGQLFPLKNVAEIQFKEVPTAIKHYNYVRGLAITARADEGFNVNALTLRCTDIMKNMRLPDGYSWSSAGEQEAMGDALNGLGRAALLAFISIFAVLVLQFRSFLQPMVIFTAMPFAIIGSILALYFTGWAFSFTAFVGITSLIGIVVNDSILLIDFANQARREGSAAVASIREAAQVRFVPIILTSLTTIGGLLPLTLQGGTLWAPMGWAIIGGLCTSTFLILLVVPALYCIFEGKDSSKIY